MNFPAWRAHAVAMTTCVALLTPVTSAQTEPPALNPFRTGGDTPTDPIEQIPEFFDPDDAEPFGVTIPFDRPMLPWPMPLPASQLGSPKPYLPAYLRPDGSVERRLAQPDALDALTVTAVAAGRQAVAHLSIDTFNLVARSGERLPGGILVYGVDASGVTLKRDDRQRRLEAP